MFRPGGIGLDVNGDGIPDVRVGPYGNVRPDVGMAYMGSPVYPPAYGGYGYGGARVDVNGDGIPDVRVGPYGNVRPDVGTFVHGPYVPPYYWEKYNDVALYRLIKINIKKLLK